MAPITSETIQWGIIGPGSIAHRFADSLVTVPGAKLHAVGSRTLARADEMADKHGAPKRYDSYEALAADPEPTYQGRRRVELGSDFRPNEKNQPFGSWPTRY